MGGKKELLAVTRAIEDFRRMRNAVLASAAYHQKEWLAQRQLLADEGGTESFLQSVDRSWAFQHKKALLLEAKMVEYMDEHLPLVEEALTVYAKLPKREAIVQRPTAGGPIRHGDLEPEIVVIESANERHFRELAEVKAELVVREREFARQRR